MGEAQFTMWDFHEAVHAEKMAAHCLAYEALSKEERAYVDEAIEAIVEHVKRESMLRYGAEMRFSPKHALEVLGAVMLLVTITDKKSPPNVKY